MDIEAKGYKVEMTPRELWSLFFWLQDSLIYTTKNHWINHQDKWQENEKERIDIIKNIASNLGRIDLFENCLLKVNEIFKEFNQTK